MEGDNLYEVYENIPDGGEPTVRAVYLSVLNRDSIYLGRALRDMEVRTGVRIVCADSEDLDGDEESFVGFMGHVREADVLLVSFHGDQSHFKKYDRMMAVVDRIGLDMLYESSLPESNEENRPRFRHPDDEYIRVRTLLDIGGEENHRSVVLWLQRTFGGIEDIEVPLPARLLTEGLCHPDLSAETPFEDYLARIDPSRPTIGVMTHAAMYQKNRMAPVHDLVRKLESLDVNVIPVFCVSSPDPLSGAIGSEAAIRKYFMDGERSRIDSLVMAMGFSQINMNNVHGDPEFRNFFLDLDVPVIQAQSVARPVERWREDMIGMSPMEIGSSIIWPEYDGQIIDVPLSFTSRGPDGEYTSVSVPDRVDRIASLAVSWAELRRKRPEDRRVAILLNMYPPTNDHVGGAAGLDTFESIRNCLIRMRELGYVVDRIPENGNEIVREVLAGITSDLEWTPEDEIPGRSLDLMDLDTYLQWYDSLTEKARAGLVRSWGDPPGPISVHGGRFIIGGVLNGNVYIGTQPNRGHHDQAEALYHDPNVVMPHQYLAVYRWLKYVYKADMVVHMGTHGSLEWLPGKGNALSADDYPDVVLDTMPNVYPYIIDDPGEGIQCKRRTNSVLISYMCPSMTRAGGYDELMDLDGTLQEYLNSRGSMQRDKKELLANRIHELVRGLDMFKELGLEEDCSREDVDEVIDLIYDYVADLKDALIKDGLHILGQVPEDERMKEMVYSLCRLRNGKVPSLRASVAEAMGLDLDALLDSPSTMHPTEGVTYGTLVDRIDDSFNELIDGMYDAGFSRDESLRITERMFGTPGEDLVSSVSYVCDHIHPSILRMTEELDNYLVGHDGRYVKPGPSGSPTRGNAHLLPTGSNMYSVDPDTIPTQSSWRIGKQMADDMIERYVKDNGCYPESIGVVLWATDTMKTCGDDIAYILWLLGIRPTWGAVGSKVTGLEIVPVEELGRPRIDVMPRITGLFRDSFPNLSDMFVEALGMIADLDESDEMNYYRKHLMRDITEYINQGMLPSEARDMASIRVFGDAPGCHGNGVSVLISSSEWDSMEQIAETYASHGAYAYGGKWKGEKVLDAFKRRVGSLNVTVKNHNDREYDLLDIDDDYDALGGMNAAAKVYGGETPYCVMGDSSDTDRLKTRTLQEETAYVMRSRVLNPKWADGLRPHGYKGAMELCKLTEYMLGWSATSGSIEPWMFNKVTEAYILDDDWRQWIDENNPYALKEMIEDMLEAIDRDLWDASEEMRERLRELYLEAEGRMEDLGSVGGIE